MAAVALMMVMTAVVLVIGLRTWSLRATRAQALALLIQAEQVWQAMAQNWQVKAQVSNGAEL